MIALYCTIIASAAAIYITERLVRFFRKPAPEPLFVPEPVREETEPGIPVPGFSAEEYLSPKERLQLKRKNYKGKKEVLFLHDPSVKPSDELSFGTISRSEFSPMIGIRR